MKPFSDKTAEIGFGMTRKYYRKLFLHLYWERDEGERFGRIIWSPKRTKAWNDPNHVYDRISISEE